MNNINKSIYYNRLIVLAILVIIFFASGSFANPNQELDRSPETSPLVPTPESPPMLPLSERRETHNRRM